MKPILRGEIYLANLNPVKGHEQAGLRPVLILQNNTLNRFLKTVVVAPITSNIAMKGLMTTYFLPAKESGLNKDSVVMMAQVRTLDKKRMIKPIGRIKKSDFMQLRVKFTQIFW